MAGVYRIPKADDEHSNYPCWIPTVGYSDHREVKPHVRCKCGVYLGIGLHHLHKDGTLTASFYHRDGPEEGDNKGCGFHEYLVFEDYNGSEWPPVPTQTK